jgi:hypothetical protein
MPISHRFARASFATIVVFSSLALAQAPPPEAQPVPGPPPPVSQPPPAAGPPPPPATEPPPPEFADPSARRHDGFYLRFGIGIGGLSMQRKGELSTSGTTGTSAYEGDSSIAGGGGAFELSIGGTVASGLVICGTLFGQNVNEPELVSDDDQFPDTELGSNLSFGLIGPGIHWYPDAEGGFHFGGTLGLAYAVAETPSGSRFEHIGGVGGGVSLAVGYDFWIADQWSLGVMGRFTGAGVSGEAEEGGVTGKEEDSISAFALMFTALHH